MNKPQAKERITKLRELISEYRYEYHVNNKSLMSEAAADSLKHELAELETQYPDLITPDSPTQRVAGQPLPQFVSVEHRVPMLSLNDVFNLDEVDAWQQRVQKLAPDAKLEYFVDTKMDGLACSLIYRDGVLKRAVTRGNGVMGEDVTSNVRTIESVPLSLRADKASGAFLSGLTEVRGEIVMFKKDFAALNKQRETAGLPLFANPRNLAAGSIRQLDPNLAAARPLNFVAWELLREDQSEVPSHSFAYRTLRSLGFYANEHAEILHDTKAIMHFAQHWQERRHKLPFNTDGLVVKINDLVIYNKLGVVGKAPRAAVAYKYPAEQSTTIVKDIFISIGRTGAATPVAVLEPVVVAGSTVQMATLHNESEVRRKDIRVGDTVIIQKAGDIIPEVVESLKNLRTGKEKAFEMPKVCPECGTELVKLKADEAVWRCPNSKCPARVQNLIQHFASKGALDIEGMGEKNVATLLDSKLIDDAADLYTITKDQLLKLDRFADISAAKLVESVKDKKNPPLSRFVFALGIRHVGAQTAVDLAKHFRSLDNLAKATINELQQVEGVGEVVAESVVAWFADSYHQKLLVKFKKVDVEPQKAAETSGQLDGHGFVITGTLQGIEREDAAEKIRSLGGTFQSSVGKTTTYLVVGDNPGESKIAKAKKLGTKRIDEAELLNILSSK
jgi:DNA ligase (NAD+)